MRPRIVEGPLVLDWMDRGACVGSDVEVFFPRRGSNATEAKRICATCTVREECLEEFIDEQFGVFGGKSESERQQIRVRRSRGVA